MNELTRELVEFWSKNGVALQPGVAPQALLEFEARNRVVLPEDLKDLLLKANGMADEEMDPIHHIRFWSLSEIKLVGEELTEIKNKEAYRSFFVFADYSLWAHAYAIRLLEHNLGSQEICVAGLPEPKVIASSFSEFARNYLTRPTKIF